MVGRKDFSEQMTFEQRLEFEQESCDCGVADRKGFRQRNYKCKGMHCVLKKNHWSYSGVKEEGSGR